MEEKKENKHSGKKKGETTLHQTWTRNVKSPRKTNRESKQYDFEKEVDIAYIDIYSVSSSNTSGSHYPLILTKTCNPKYCSEEWQTMTT